MTSGSPVGSGLMRQRHSQGYASSGDDLEDGGCLRFSPMLLQVPSGRTWIEIVEIFLWIASAAFVVYFGDRHSNLIYLLWHDSQIKRSSFALWPIWSFLTLPLLFTLFMACMVIFPHIMIETFRTQIDVLRTD